MRSVSRRLFSTNKVEDFTRIVVTGGPCGGKTTILTKFAKIFEQRGFRVYTVPEAATLLNTAGFKINQSDEAFDQQVAWCSNLVST
jgi:nucleoside-triphosphatase THEP1